MSRHLENLQRLFQKLHYRYGPEDALVAQFQDEINTVLDAQSIAPDWTEPQPLRLNNLDRASRMESLGGRS